MPLILQKRQVKVLLLRQRVLSSQRPAPRALLKQKLMRKITLRKLKSRLIMRQHLLRRQVEVK